MVCSDVSCCSAIVCCFGNCGLLILSSTNHESRKKLAPTVDAKGRLHCFLTWLEENRALLRSLPASHAAASSIKTVPTWRAGMVTQHRHREGIYRLYTVLYPDHPSGTLARWKKRGASSRWNAESLRVMIRIPVHSGKCPGLLAKVAAGRTANKK